MSTAVLRVNYWRNNQEDRISSQLKDFFVIVIELLLLNNKAKVKLSHRLIKRHTMKAKCRSLQMFFRKEMHT